MTSVSTRFCTNDPYLFFIGSFSYDPQRCSRWNTYLSRIERSLAQSCEIMLQKCESPDWEMLRAEVAKLDFVTESTPGHIRCMIDRSEMIYNYRILHGQYSTSLSYNEATNGNDSERAYQVVYPESEGSV